MASLPASKSEKLELQSMNRKFDSERNSSEMFLLYDQFKSCLHQFKSCLDLFQQQTTLNFPSLTEPFATEDLGERAMSLAQFYPEKLVKFPTEIVKFLASSARSLPSGFRVQLTRALILLINRKIIGIAETLEVFMELQTLGDTVLQQLAFFHVTQSIKNDPNNKALQNILFGILQQEDAAKAKRALITLCDLHRRKVWSDDRTANAICMACFHPSSRIMIAALSFLLDFEIQDDDSDSEDDQATPQPQLVLNKEAMYKASHKDTTSRKKKKKAKLQRIARSMKNQHQLSSEKSNTNYCSPLNHLEDAQEFSEKLFSRLQSSSNERLEVKMMMIKVVARTVGLHHLILLDLYPYLQKYVQPHERDIKTLLAAAVQACHEMVPPGAVESLFKQIIDQFVLDQTQPEVITAGLNVVREICLRMPLLMTEELLQDLVLYTKSHERSVSVSAMSLLTLFIEMRPSLLVKKDRGRPAELKAKSKAFGEVHVPSNIPGIELLGEEDGADEYDNIIRKDADYDSKKPNEKRRKLSYFEGQLNAGNMSLGALEKLINTATKDDVEPIRDGKAMKLKATRTRSYLTDFLSLECQVMWLTEEELLAALKGSGWKDPGNLSFCALRNIGLIKLQKELKKPEIARTLHQKIEQIVDVQQRKHQEMKQIVDVQRRKHKCSRKS